MIDFLFGFMFGMFVTLLGAMLAPRRRLSPGKGGAGRGPAPLRRVQPGELVMPWRHKHLIRAEGFRYWRWQDEQVRQALEEDTTTPPGGTP